MENNKAFKVTYTTLDPAGLEAFTKPMIKLSSRLRPSLAALTLIILAARKFEKRMNFWTQALLTKKFSLENFREEEQLNSMLRLRLHLQLSLPGET